MHGQNVPLNVPDNEGRADRAEARLPGMAVSTDDKNVWEGIAEPLEPQTGEMSAATVSLIREEPIKWSAN